METLVHVQYASRSSIGCANALMLVRRNLKMMNLKFKLSLECLLVVLAVVMNFSHLYQRLKDVPFKIQDARQLFVEKGGFKNILKI